MILFLCVLAYLAVLLCAYVHDKLAEERDALKAELEDRKKDKCVDISPCQACPPDPIIYPYGTLVDVYLRGELFAEGAKVVGYYKEHCPSELHYRVKHRGHVNEVHHTCIKKHISYQEKLDLIDEELDRYRQELNSHYGIEETPISRILKD